MIAGIGATFAESLRATFQPCTFLLIAPILTAVVAARASWQALVAATAACMVGGWILLDNRWILEGWSLRLSAVVVAGILLLIAVEARPSTDPSASGPLNDAPLVDARSWPSAAGAGVVALAATMWWRPCVGTELGEILNGAQVGVAEQLLPMAAYMLGALVPVVMVVAIRYAVDPPPPVVTVAASACAGIGFVVAMSLAAGQHDDVVVTLTRWTLD